MKGHRWPPIVILLLLVILAGAGAVLAVRTAAQTVSGPGGDSLDAAAPEDGSEALPPGAQVQTVQANLGFAVAMVFDSQGRLFYTEKPSAASSAVGNVRLYANGVLQTSPVITFSVDSCSER